METKITSNKTNESNDVAKQTEKIVQPFRPTHAPYTTVVTYKGGMKFHGYFEHFEDKKELLEIGRVRFIPNNNSVEFRDSIAKTGTVNYRKYSIIIDLTITTNIKLIDPVNGIVLKEVDLIE